MIDPILPNGSKLTFVRMAKRKANGKLTGLFKCECGSEKELRVDSVKSGNTKSCGCSSRLNTSLEFSEPYRKSSEYQSWKNMIARCHGTSDPKKQRWYADKGITVCDRWRHSFAAFVEDMGARPARKTIDRIDGTLGYFPENCRWATSLEQAANRKTSLAFGTIFSFDGRSGTIQQLFDQLRPAMTLRQFRRKLCNRRYRSKAISEPRTSPQ